MVGALTSVLVQITMMATSPMFLELGYLPWRGINLTIGSRQVRDLVIDFTTAKFSDAFDTYSYNSLDFGVGLFSRMKFLNNWFVHMEYSWLNETIAYLYPGYIEKERQWRDILLFGIGYTSGGDVAYEIYVNYDFFEDPDSYRVPIVYRAGISFKF